MTCKTPKAFGFFLFRHMTSAPCCSCKGRGCQSRLPAQPHYQVMLDLAHTHIADNPVAAARWHAIIDLMTASILASQLSVFPSPNIYRHTDADRQTDTHTHTRLLADGQAPGWSTSCMRDCCTAELLLSSATSVLVALDMADDSSTSWNSPSRSTTAPKLAMDSNCTNK